MKTQTIISQYSFLLFGIMILISSCTEDEEPIQPEIPIASTFTDIPDENFEKRLIELGIDSDDSLNHRILKEDALKVTSLILDVPLGTDEENKITNLTGIEAFKNLDSLSVGNHALVELDLSSNTQLEWLHIIFNYLQSLDISNNHNLIEVNVHFNELTEIKGLDEKLHLKRLNLSWNYLESLIVNLPALEGLNIEDNLLTELDLNSCSSLTSLIAKVNALETIDLSTNVKLQFITLSDNQLTGLNLTNNIVLEKLRIFRNQLENLDVSMLNVLNELGISQNSNLNCVKIADGQTIATVNKGEHQALSVNPCD